MQRRWNGHNEPAPHDNFAGVLPTVYRGPYEFAVRVRRAIVMQTEPEIEAERVSGNGHNGHRR